MFSIKDVNHTIILSLTVEMAEKLILLGFTAILLLRKCGYI